MTALIRDDIWIIWQKLSGGDDMPAPAHANAVTLCAPDSLASINQARFQEVLGWLQRRLGCRMQATGFDRQKRTITLKFFDQIDVYAQLACEMLARDGDALSRLMGLGFDEVRIAEPNITVTMDDVARLGSAVKPSAKASNALEASANAGSDAGGPDHTPAETVRRASAAGKRRKPRKKD